MILAQISEQVVASLISSSPFGALLLWFMWRDSKKIDVMIEALNHLIQMEAIEVNSRPHLTDRTKEEVSELLAAVERRRRGK